MMSESHSVPLRLLGYARSSSDRQEKSVPDQVEWIGLAVERRGHALLAPPFTDEGVPGRFLSREGFDRMLAMCRDLSAAGDPPDGIIIWHLNRFSRADGWDTIEVWNELRRHGLRLLLTSTRTYDLTNKTDRLLLTIEQDGESNYSPSLAENVTRGMLSRAKGGLCVSSPPFGYRTLYRASDRAGRQAPDHWEIEPAEAAVVRRIFRLYAGGKHTLRSIAELLNREGVPTPSVLRGRKNAKALWSISSVRNVLSNDAYLGFHTWNRRRSGTYFCAVDGVPVERPERERQAVKGKKGKRGRLMKNPPKQWHRRENAHEPLVDVETFEKVAAMLARNRAHPAACRNRRVYRFAGLLRCGCCRGGMVGKGGKWRNNIYACSASKQKGPSACKGLSVNEARLLAALGRKLREQFTPEFLDAFAEAVRRELAGDPADLDAERARLEARRADLDRLLAEEGERYLRVPNWMLPQVEAAAKKLHTQRDEVALDLARLQRRQAPADVDGLVARAREALGRLEEVLADSDPAEVRAVLREHIDRIEVYFGEPAAGEKSSFARAAVFLGEGSPLRYLADPSHLSQTGSCSTTRTSGWGW
jgi:site-specific DNA recombinase